MIGIEEVIAFSKTIWTEHLQFSAWERKIRKRFEKELRTPEERLKVLETKLDTLDTEDFFGTEG